MPERKIFINSAISPLVKIEANCLVGRIDTEVVNNQAPVILQRIMESGHNAHEAILDRDANEVKDQATEMLILATKLYFVSVQWLEDQEEDRKKYAPHPTFIP